MSCVKILARLCFFGGVCASGSLGRAEETPSPKTPQRTVETDRLAASVDPAAGTLTALKNKLTGEIYAISDDHFSFEASAGMIAIQDARLTAIDIQPRQWTAKYRQADTEVEAVYTASDHFLQKRLAVTFAQPTALLRAEVSRPAFAAGALELMSYGYPKFERKPGAEPCRTFFGRTAKGGLFTGIEMPFADASLADSQVKLAFAPNLKLKAGEKFDCEPVYFGIYQRLPDESENAAEPLRSESDAMVAMTSAVLGAPRHGLAPMACGWHSEMTQGAYSAANLEGDMKSLDFLAECGIDYASDSHPWGGETEKLNKLIDDQPLEIGDFNRKFLDHAEKVNVKVVTWLTMNNSHPWAGGKPYRPDKPEWLLMPDADHYRGAQGLDPPPHGNCVANQPFLDWLMRINREAMTAGKSRAWCVDGDFFGSGGWFTTVVPVRCLSDQHDHLPGDCNFCCQRALDRLIADVRKHNPQMYIFACRPPMDLGVWSQHNFDVCFTLLENGTPANNIAAGDGIRHWSRIRVHRDFFPHYLDQPLLFPSYASADWANHRWQSSEHLDYILLSAMSSSPNQLYYLPTKTGIPDADKQTLKRWLDWGREHIRHLLVRKDLPDWPAAGKVDGSAHIVDDQGLIFLFNGGQQPAEGQFALSEESIGLKRGERFRVRQHYPQANREVLAKRNETVRWPLAPETAVVIEVLPAE